MQSDNDGPTLPPEMQNRLFEPMVSVREQAGDEVHLGLGLHVARLISEFHGGELTARNRPTADGVRVSLSLPAIEASETL